MVIQSYRMLLADQSIKIGLIRKVRDTLPNEQVGLHILRSYGHCPVGFAVGLDEEKVPPRSSYLGFRYLLDSRS